MQVTALAMTPRMFAVNACIYLFTVSYLVVSYYHYAHVDSENRLQNCPEVIMNYKLHGTKETQNNGHWNRFGQCNQHSVNIRS